MEKQSADKSRYRENATHDLHFHYDGSVSKGVVARVFSRSEEFRRQAEAIAAETVIRRPLESPEDFFRGFGKIMEVIRIAGSVFPILVAEFEEAANAGIKHLDLRFGCGALSRNLGISEDEVLQQFRQATFQAKKLGLEICPTLCFSRHETMKRAHFLRDFILKNRDFIRAIDLEGPEVPNPTRAFADIFQELRAAGLRVTVHAGEFAPAESIWEAVDSCGAERLGHAFSAASDQTLLRRLAKDQIPVEVCLSSNCLLGLCPDTDAHPFLKMLEAGVPVVLCTDDQAMFGTSLAQEYEKAETALTHVTREARTIIEAIASNSRKFAFSDIRVASS